jgi:hypothetical protein
MTRAELMERLSAREFTWWRVLYETEVAERQEAEEEAEKQRARR